MQCAHSVHVSIVFASLPCSIPRLLSLNFAKFREFVSWQRNISIIFHFIFLFPSLSLRPYFSLFSFLFTSYGFKRTATIRSSNDYIMPYVHLMRCMLWIFDVYALCFMLFLFLSHSPTSFSVFILFTITCTLYTGLLGVAVYPR